MLAIRMLRNKLVPGRIHFAMFVCISLVKAENVQSSVLWSNVEMYHHLVNQLENSSLEYAYDNSDMNSIWLEQLSCDTDNQNNVAMDDTNIIHILLTLLNHLQWTNIIIIYEPDYDDYIATMTTLSNNSLFTLFRIQCESMNETLWKQSTCGELNIMLQDQMSAKSRNKSLDHFLDCLYNMVTQETEINVVMLCSDDCLNYLLLKVNKVITSREINKTLHLTSRWLLVLTATNDKNSVANILVNLNQVVNVAVLQATSNSSTPTTDRLLLHTSMSSNQVATVSSLYYGNGNIRYLNDVALVTADKEMVQLGDHGIFPNENFLLNQRQLIVSIAQWPPFIIQDKEGVYSGFNMDILKHLESLLNFTSVLVDSTDQEWGQMQENGIYTGLIGQLQRKEVDILMAPVAVDTDRAHVMDFTFPYFSDYTTVVLKKPDPDWTKWLTLIEPFTWQVHVAIFISLLCITVFTTMMERINPYYIFKNQPSPFYGYIHCLWYMYGALINQGGEYLPKSLTARTLLTSWWIFTLVISSTYSGNLFAFLTVTKQSPPFDTVQGMLGQSDFKWGIVGKSIIEFLFQNTNDSSQSAVWEKIKLFNQSDPTVLSLDLNVHFSKVQEGGYFFIGDKSVADFWVERQCDLVRIKENFFPVEYAIGLVNDSAYTQIFSEQIIKMSEFGLLSIWKSRWWPTENICNSQRVTAASVISVLDLQSAFYLLCVGIFISVCMLCLENLLAQSCSKCLTEQ